MTRLLKKVASTPKSLLNELKKVWLELKQVNWISRSSAFRSTVLVLVGTILMTLVILGIDNLLFAARSFLLTRTAL